MIKMIKWIRTSRLPIKNSLSLSRVAMDEDEDEDDRPLRPRKVFFFTLVTGLRRSLSLKLSDTRVH
jgi:hypothetical protein